MNPYSVNSPVLLILFNRPDTTQLVFDKIRLVKPSRLYLSADGPRPGNTKDAGLCEQARSVADQIDWPCKLFTLFSKENKGCKIAVSDAITWFFKYEEEGIILEDDCLPADSFFYYCDTMLERYRNDTRINIVSGTNLKPSGFSGKDSYHFSRFTAIWGWASWRRVWNKYDRYLTSYTEDDVQYYLKSVFNDNYLHEEWKTIFRELKQNKIDTWDFQLCFMNFFEGALSIVPSVNLISNIGFRADATHTPDAFNPHANMPTGEILSFNHPKFILADTEADHKILMQEFNLDHWWSKPKKILLNLKKSLSVNN